VEIEGWLQFEAVGHGATEFFGITEDRGHTPNRSRVAFWAESKTSVEAFAVELQRIGALNVEGPELIDTGYYAVYFDDPSGNALEICYRSKRFNEC
jgi:predicted lactoylglutathione lyase